LLTFNDSFTIFSIARYKKSIGCFLSLTTYLFVHGFQLKK
jgi:hypothetical protein